MLSRSLSRPLWGAIHRPLDDVSADEAANPVDPLAGLEFLFKGYGLPTGAFQDSSLTTPAVADGDPFGGWEDENGVLFSQATAGSRGQLKDVSGSWAWRGDGTDDYLIRTNFFLPGDFSIFAKVNYGSVGGMIVGGNNAGAVNSQVLRFFNGYIAYYPGSGADATISDSAVPGYNLGPVIIGIIRSGSTIRLYAGETMIGETTSAYEFTAGCIGGVVVGGGLALPYSSDLYGVLIADTDMTANLSQINAALDLL